MIGRFKYKFFSIRIKHCHKNDRGLALFENEVPTSFEISDAGQSNIKNSDFNSHFKELQT